MNLENVKALADVLCAKGLSAIEVGEGENRIRIERETAAVSMLAQPVQVPAHTPLVMTEAVAPAPAETAVISEVGNPSVDFNHLTEVKSPLVGVYYSAASPDAENFVSIGSKVKKGDVLCILEAMKIMNELVAEVDGTIAEVFPQDGTMVEALQPLFIILLGD
jgi:acetyl-CoA carboxylase biotin carboxyl carrier protein